VFSYSALVVVGLVVAGALPVSQPTPPAKPRHRVHGDTTGRVASVERLGTYRDVHLLYYGIELRPQQLDIEVRHRPGPDNTGYSVWLRCSGDRLLDSLGIARVPLNPPLPPRKPEREPYESRHGLEESIATALRAKAAAGWSPERQMAYRLARYRRSPLVMAVRPGNAYQYEIQWAGSPPTGGRWEICQISWEHNDRTSSGWATAQGLQLANYLEMRGAVAIIDWSGVENQARILNGPEKGYLAILPTNIAEHLRHGSHDLRRILRGDGP
jgi:hypothetical protein